MNLFRRFLAWLLPKREERKKIERVKKLKRMLKAESMAKTVITKSKRNAWLTSKGYTIPPKKLPKKKHEKQDSYYVRAVKAFISHRKTGKIREIYNNGLSGAAKKLIRNKYGIPFYELKGSAI